jgi:ribosomal protein S21
MGVKVELKLLNRNASEFDKDKAFKGMLAAFKRLVNETGVLTDYNRKKSYESKGQKRRRKEKEAALARRKTEILHSEELQTKWREHFGRG